MLSGPDRQGPGEGDGRGQVPGARRGARLHRLVARLAGDPSAHQSRRASTPAIPTRPATTGACTTSSSDRARATGSRSCSPCPPIPSGPRANPNGCPHHIGGYANLALRACGSPTATMFGQFAQAIRRPRYKGHASSPTRSGTSPTSSTTCIRSGRCAGEAGTVDLGGKALPRAVDVEACRAHHVSDPSGSEGRRPLRRDGGHQLADRHPLRGALCLSPSGRPLQAGPHEAAAWGAPSPVAAAHPRPRRPPVQQPRARLAVHALGHSKDSLAPWPTPAAAAPACCGAASPPRAHPAAGAAST